MTIIQSRAAPNARQCSTPWHTHSIPEHSQKKDLTPASKAHKLLSWRTSAPRKTLLYIMITKIKKAIVGAVLTSDTFKSTLEKVVSEEVEACVENNDDLVTDEKLDRAIRDAGYDYEYTDRDEVREIANEEIEEANFLDRDEFESDVKEYFAELIKQDEHCAFVSLEALDIKLKQHMKKFCEQSVSSLTEHLAAYVKLLEKEGDE